MLQNGTRTCQTVFWAGEIKGQATLLAHIGNWPAILFSWGESESGEKQEIFFPHCCWIILSKQNCQLFLLYFLLRVSVHPGIQSFPCLCCCSNSQNILTSTHSLETSLNNNHEKSPLSKVVICFLQLCVGCWLFYWNRVLLDSDMSNSSEDKM